MARVQDLAEAAAFQKLRDHKRRAVILADIVNARIFGWLSAATARASCSKRRKRRDRAQKMPGAASPRHRGKGAVARTINLAHAASADQRNDSVRPEGYRK